MVSHLGGLPTAATSGPSTAGPPGDPTPLQVFWVGILGWDPRAGTHLRDKACKTICKIIPFFRQRKGRSETSQWGKAVDGLHRPTEHRASRLRQPLLPLFTWSLQPLSRPPLVSIVGSWGQPQPRHLVFIRLRNSPAVIFPFRAPFTPNPAALAESHCSASIAFLLDAPESSNEKYIVLKDPLYIILVLSLNPSFNTSGCAGQSHTLCWILHLKTCARCCRLSVAARADVPSDAQEGFIFFKHADGCFLPL